MADNDETVTQDVKDNKASEMDASTNELVSTDLSQPSSKEIENSDQCMDLNEQDAKSIKNELDDESNNAIEPEENIVREDTQSTNGINEVKVGEDIEVDSTRSEGRIITSKTQTDSKLLVNDVQSVSGQETSLDCESTASVVRPCHDNLLRHLSNKFTHIGTPQLISKIKPPLPFSTTNNETKAPKAEKSCTESKNIKYVIRNVTKSTKIAKVSNNGYRIKPVRENIVPSKNQKIQYPVVFVGEPFFVDTDDYNIQNGDVKNNSQQSMSETIPSQPEVIKEESLYDISSLKDSFLSPPDFKSIKTEIRNFFYPAPDTMTPTFIRKMNIPFPKQPLTSHKAGFNMPRNVVLNSNISNGMVRLVARTVPSATKAGSVFTMVKPNTTSSQSSLPKLQKLKTIQQMGAKQIIHIHPKSSKNPKTTVVNVPKPIITPPVPVPTQPLKLKPIPALKPLVTKVTSSIPSKKNVMHVKIVPRPNKVVATAKVQTSGAKTPIPVQILSSLPSVSKVIKVSSGGSSVFMNKKPTTAVFVSANTNKFTHNISTATKSTEKGILSPIKIMDTASAALTKIVNKHKAETVETKSISTPAQVEPVYKSKFIHNKPLREGVEVAFEDGVQHFISSLRQITYLDDELIKSWSDLKKGMKVAAKWTDGLIYDATVVSCYFSADKKNANLEPELKLQKIDDSSPVKLPIEKPKPATIACTNCEKIFSSLKTFRKHQKRVCKGKGIILSNGNASVKTENVVAPIVKIDCKLTAKDQIESTIENTVGEKTEISMLNSGERMEKNDIIGNSETKISKQPQKRKIKSAEEIDEKPAKKKRKISENIINGNKLGNDDTQATPAKLSYVNFIFKKGTQFLHRWQLDDGGSKWYHGEVMKILTRPKSIIECEFEVKYKGEEDVVYRLKLYEDYPADIRIMGGS